MTFDRARAKPGASGALRLWILGFGMALAAALAGCSTNTNVSNGTPVVTVTSQAAGDFSTYVVGITLYSATRSDGYIAYPAGYTYEEFADLTQRVDLTELLNAVGIPTGTYKTVTIGIDYSSPIVYIKGQSTAAKVENASGAQNFGIVYVNVKLDPAHPLVIGLNQSTPLALDFDLAASNTVNATSNVVTVKPFAVATTTPADTEPVRARGLFVAANTGASNFVEDIRPFQDNIYSTVGALTVNTSSSTYFNVNGKVYTGAAGLAAVAGLSSNTPMIAIGSLGDMSTITPGINATQVYAGTPVSNGQYEHVTGVVTARSGNTLTVSDATYLYYEGYCTSNLCFNWYPSLTVTVGPSTVVTEDGTSAATALSAQSISVGSTIDAVGINTNNANPPKLDATSGLVRLQSTPAWGTLVSGASGSATLNLLSMGPVPASAINFAGTGLSGADATAASYGLDTAAATTGADQTATAAGTLLRADGFPTPFGTAPPDFTATAVTPGTSEPADLVVEWSAGSSGSLAPFTSYDSTSLSLNLTGDTLAEVVIGPQVTPLTTAPAITISGGTEFAIGNAASGVSQFSTSSGFASDLTSTLNGSTQVYRVVAVGSYDSGTNTFTASRVDVALE
ncbi:MAG TPA: hypothetical protein VFN79_06295 [Steroidobacteraceae bacterium]|nr:hypothetical protein [Steroidobacteraceae bacterium]